MVQRLVQKEKEAAQLRETIERMEKKYKDRAEFVTVSFFSSFVLAGSDQFYGMPSVPKSQSLIQQGRES